MRKYRLQLRNVQNVAASKTASIFIPIGQRIHYILLKHGYSSGTNTIAAAATNIQEIRFIVGSNVQRKFSGTELRDMNLLHGTKYDCLGVPNTAPGVSFPLFFAEPWRKTVADQVSLALPTRWQGGAFEFVKIEVDLGAATSPTLEAWAVVDDAVPALPSGQRVPWFTKFVRQQFPAAGTSFDISTLDKKDFLSQISLYKDSGGNRVATKVTLRKNGTVIHEYTAAANRSLLTHHDMTPAASGRTADIYDLVLDHDDLLSSAEPLFDAADLSLTIEAADAMSGTVTGFIQRTGPPE